jgi:hypothetical protein
VQVVGGPAIVRDEQQPEADLGDQQCLDECNDVAEQASGIPVPKVRRCPPDGRGRRRAEDTETDDLMGA